MTGDRRPAAERSARCGRGVRRNGRARPAAEARAAGDAGRTPLQSSDASRAAVSGVGLAAPTARLAGSDPERRAEQTDGADDHQRHELRIDGEHEQPRVGQRERRGDAVGVQRVDELDGVLLPRRQRGGVVEQPVELAAPLATPPPARRARPAGRARGSSSRSSPGSRCGVLPAGTLTHGVPETLVIGAGPAGLAVAAELRRRGLGATVVDRAEAVGSTWRCHYERLHLHTARAFSGLPGMAIPGATAAGCRGRAWSSTWRRTRPRTASSRGSACSSSASTGRASAGARRRRAAPSRPIGSSSPRATTTPRSSPRGRDASDSRASSSTRRVSLGRGPPRSPRARRRRRQLGRRDRRRPRRAGRRRRALAVRRAEVVPRDGARRAGAGVRDAPAPGPRARRATWPQTAPGGVRRRPAPVRHAGRCRRRLSNLRDRGAVPLLDVGLVRELAAAVSCRAGRRGVRRRRGRARRRRTAGSRGRRLRHRLPPRARAARRAPRRAGTPRPARRPRRGEAPTAPGIHFVGYTNPISGNLRELGIDARRIAATIAGR